MPVFNTPTKLAALISVLILTSCQIEKENVSNDFRGGGSETTIVGRVVDASGLSVSGAEIRIRPENDLPPNLFNFNSVEVVDLPMALTGSDGTYRLSGIHSGSYYVECRSTKTAALLRAEIGNQDSLHLPDAILRPTGCIKGRIGGTGDSLNEMTLYAVYVYIPGLWKRQIADPSNGWTFLIQGIPAGRYSLRLQPAYPNDLERFKVLELQNVEVTSGATLDLDSLTLQDRRDLKDSVYTRDSLAAWAIHLANILPGQEPPSSWVSGHTSVLGNRLIMLYDLSGGIHTIPKSIRSLDALELIYLRGGMDSLGLTVDMDPEISNLPHLKRLWLININQNNLPVWTGKFPELANLALSGMNRFPQWILDIPTLTELRLAGGSMTSLPKEISRLKKLRVLNLSDNHLETLPQELMQMTSLQGVRLRWNKLCATTPEEKIWIGYQDSLWTAQADPLEYGRGVDTLGWMETQVCEK